MKLSFLPLAAIALAVACPGLAQTAAKETPELSALKTRYQLDVTVAMKPIQARYVSQLESLLKTFTQRGDLAAALAVQQELDTVKAAAKSDGDATAHRTTKSAFIGGTWSWISTDPSDSESTEFFEDGTGSHGGRGNTKWEATSNREITITHPTKGKASIRLGADSKSFSGTGYNGKPVSGKRIR